MSWSDYSFRPLEWIGLGGKQATVKKEEGTATLSVRPERVPLESAESLAARRIKVIDADQGEASYKYLTHHLQPNERSEIESEVASISDKQVDDLMQTINRCDYQALEGLGFKSFQGRRGYEERFLYPYIALAAVQKGKMSEAEFSSVMFYWSIKRSSYLQVQVKIIRLFDADGAPNKDVINAIEQTCYAPKEATVRQMAGFKQNRPFATPDQMSAFFEAAASLPPSQQCIFVTEDHLFPSEREGVGMNQTLEKMRESRIIRQVRYGASFNFFDQFRSQGKDQHGFPTGTSLEMMGTFGVYQTMGKVLFGENCVALRPTIGVSTVEEIQEDGRTDQRDLGLPFPGVLLPDKADEFRCETPEEFVRHDIGYHFWVTSMVPANHRKAIEAIADETRELLTDPSLSEVGKRYLNELYERLIDMEFPPYRSDFMAPQDPDVQFVSSLNILFALTVSRIYLSEGSDFEFRQRLGAPASAMDALVKVITTFSKDKVLQKLAEKLYAQRERFKAEFGIELFNQEALSKAQDAEAGTLRNVLPEKFHTAFDWVGKLLAKRVVGYAASFISLPQVLMNLRAKKQFARQLEDLRIH